MTRYDVAIVGSGFAGSILARALRQRGLEVLLIERGQHPRFALGESSTPLAGFALERLAARYDLPDLHALAAYGRWREHLPQLRCGLKRGFTFYQHEAASASTHPSRLLVAASPNDALADCHWLRADVDAHLVHRARDEGVVYRDHTTLDTFDADERGVTLRGIRHDRRVIYRASWLVDASGPHGFLARALALPTRPVAVDSALVYAHLDGLEALPMRDDWAPGPYPDHQAAVHHLHAGGWTYVLPFDHGAASAGTVLRNLPPGFDAARAARDPAALWRAALQSAPRLADTMARAQPITPVRFQARIQHRLLRAAGERWFLLPHGYAFTDPMFSTGMAWSLLAVERLADLLTGTVTATQIALYARRLHAEADQIEQLIAAAAEAQGDFERFAAVTMLYFATVSFEELRQRLTPDDQDPWRGFLAADDPAVQRAFAEARARRRGSTADFAAWVSDAIAPRNVIGLMDPARNYLYPVDLALLIDRAPLLGLTARDIRAALPRLRGAPSPPPT